MVMSYKIKTEFRACNRDIRLFRRKVNTFYRVSLSFNDLLYVSALRCKILKYCYPVTSPSFEIQKIILVIQKNTQPNVKLRDTKRGFLCFKKKHKKKV